MEGVAEVAVFGLPDDRWGQRVCAALVLTGGDRRGAGGRCRGRGDRPRRAGRRGCPRRAHLAAYKRPKQYVVVDALPRTATGKLQRTLIPGLVTDPSGPA